VEARPTNSFSSKKIYCGKSTICGKRNSPKFDCSEQLTIGVGAMVQEGKVGYYAFVQYCPDRFMAEYVNIGVVLLVPEIDFLSIRLVENNKRIKRFFGEQKNWMFIDEQKQFITEKLKRAKESILSKDDFNVFRKRLGNDVQLSELRSIKVSDPGYELDQLFSMIDEVEIDVKKPSEILHEKLDNAFKSLKVDGMLEKPSAIKIKKMNRKITAPYGFQNGRYNFIKPFIYNSKNYDKFCMSAINGQALFEQEDDKFGEMKLVMVGKFDSSSEDEIGEVGNVLQQHSVGFYTIDNIEPLADEIRKASRIKFSGQSSV
jgi:hypothetical protein